MGVGIGMHVSNTGDGDRHEAAERGGEVPSARARSDAPVLQEEPHIADVTEELGLDAIWSVEHHVTPIRLAEQAQLLQEVMGADCDLIAREVLPALEEMSVG